MLEGLFGGIMLLQSTDAWKKSCPGAVVGVMAMADVHNPPEHVGLDSLKENFEAQVRSEYAGLTRAMLEQLPSIQPYVAYYKRFNKSYHVLFQLESVAHKGKKLPHVAALVEAMFMAELKNQMLTAGHDLDLIRPPVELDVADGSQTYTLLGGQLQTLKVGDMFISDQEGVVSSIVYGPDQRTPITVGTRNVLFTVYAPQGIGPKRVEDHLKDIRDYVMLVAPSASVAALEIHPAQ
jgi:DNA/RNA-binding domain of Phe-tRNA-synthetase-like protein